MNELEARVNALEEALSECIDDITDEAALLASNQKYKNYYDEFLSKMRAVLENKYESGNKTHARKIMSHVGKQWHGPTLDGKPVVLFRHRDAARAYNRSRHVKGGVIDLDGILDSSKNKIASSDRWAVFA